MTVEITEAGKRVCDGRGSVSERAVTFARAEDWAGLLRLARRAPRLRLSAARTADRVRVHVGYGAWCLAVVDDVHGHIGLGGYKLIEGLLP